MSKRAKKEKALPLDTPDWMPLEDVHQLRCRLTGDPGLAAQDVTNVLARRVRSMRRWRVGGFERGSKPDRKRLPFAFWAEHELHWSDGLSVIRRPHFADILSDIIILQGFVGYAWKPDLAEIWPALFGSPPAQQATTTPQPPTISDKPRSIREFCRLHGISEDQFYKMKREGWGPTTMKVGSRTLISHEAAAAWRAEREAAAKEAAAKEAVTAALMPSTG